MVSISRKIKLFKRLFNEFLNEYNKLTGKNFSIKIKEYEILEKYNLEIKNNLDKFIECESDIINKITLCKSIEMNINNQVFINNKSSIWNYLHNLYFITMDSVDSEIILKSKEYLSKLQMQLVPKDTGINLENLNLDDPGMGDLISDIAKQVTDKLKGQDLSNIDPMQLMSQMLAGGHSVNGIDFGSIIQDTANKIKTKVENGEIDLDKLKNQAKGLISDKTIASQLD